MEAQIEEISRRLTADVPEATERELMDFYQEHAEFDEPACIRLAILIECDAASEQSRLQALAKTAALHGQISSGAASFEAIAREHSECHASREAGGDLGWIRPGSLDSALEEAAFALQPGEISSPLQSPQGFHLLMLEERREPYSLPFSEVRERIIEHLQKVARNKTLDRAIKDLHAAALQKHKHQTRPETGDLPRRLKPIYENNQHCRNSACHSPGRRTACPAPSGMQSSRTCNHNTARQNISLKHGGRQP